MKGENQNNVNTSFARVQEAVKKLQVLELKPDATIHQVKKAYRTLAMVWHPDRFPSNDKLRKTAQEKLKKINEAYEWLINNKDLLPLKKYSEYNFNTEKDYTTAYSKNKKEPRQQNPNPSSQEQTNISSNDGKIKSKYFVLLIIITLVVWFNSLLNKESVTTSVSSPSPNSSIALISDPNQTSNDERANTELNITPSSLITSNNSEINSNQRIEIFQQKFVSSPDTSIQITRDKLLYLKKNLDNDDFWNSELNLILLEKVGNKWGRLKHATITNGTNSTLNSIIKSIEIVPIRNSVYLYFEKFIPGGSMGNKNIEFTLFEINSNKKFYIDYIEMPKRQFTFIDFKKSANLTSKKFLSHYLEKKINSSSKIHSPNKREKLIREFIVTNEKALEELAASPSMGNPIKFEKITTKEEIFSINPNRRSKTIKASIVSRIENINFIVISIFKGAVIGYNKNTQEFFCVWTPESMYSWIGNLRFDSDGNLILYDRLNNKPVYQINLFKSTYLNLEG